MSTAKQFFEEYVRDRRGQIIDGYTLEDLGYLVRYTTHTAADDFVTFSRLQPSEAESIIEDQIAYFRSKRKSFDSKFPELNGGAVLQEFRGRGIYKALYGQRLAEAAKRGYERLTVDASPMSRPILERMGFIHICSTTPLCYKIA